MSGQDLPARIRALRTLSVPDLRRRYEELSGRTTKTDNRPWLVGAIYRRMVEGEDVEGRNARRALARALHAALQPRRRPAQTHDPRIPPIGSVLRREHGDRIVEVNVVRDGFRFEGRLYPSLSAIAREVTGAHWNGLLWFGLTGRSRDSKAAGGPA